MSDVRGLHRGGSVMSAVPADIHPTDMTREQWVDHFGDARGWANRAELPEFEAPPEEHPRLADDVLDMLTCEQLRVQAVAYVADHGWDSYARVLMMRMRAFPHRPGCSRRQIAADADTRRATRQ